MFPNLNTPELKWFRLWTNGPGLAFNRTPPNEGLFSRRQGFTRELHLFGWWVKYLPRLK